MTLALTIKTVSSQITLDNIVGSTYQIGWSFFPVQLDANETKYLFRDTTANTFSLYNMNFSPYLLNVALPGAYNYNYQIMYVTRRLFDCDSTNIEYVYSAPLSLTLPFSIYRTSGTLLFKLDSAAGPYCYGCFGGADEVHPIRNTSAGAKMFLMKYDPTYTNTKTYVYSLCASLPTGYYELSNKLSTEVKVFPNPTNNQLIFEVDIAGNISKYNLTIYDVNGKEIKKESDIKTRRFTLDASNFASGVYFYSLTNDSKTINSGKFIMTN